MKPLISSSEIRAEIVKLSSATDRRIAIVAFVGEGAEAYLPSPKKLEIICWPKAGGTNPNVLRSLMKHGVKISFVDALHMKLYWCTGRGVIITSANLSTNALGVGNLREFGVLLPAESIDIDSLISKLKPRGVSVQELRKLDRLHNLYFAKNKNKFRSQRPKDKSYPEWYESDYRPDWRLLWWDKYLGSASPSAKEISMFEYGVADPCWAQECRPGEFKEGDWTLSFRLSSKGAANTTWMFVDYVVSLSNKEKRRSGYPCEAVQVWPLNRYPERPFRIDAEFRRAFSKAVKEYGAQKVRGLRSSIYSNYRARK